MNILALDPATLCGWAHSSGRSGTWDLSAKKDESVGMRLFKLKSMLNNIMNSFGIDLLVFEAVIYGGMQGQRAMIVQAELQGVIKLWCEEQRPILQYKGFGSNVIKKHATGKGNAKKAAMIDAACVRWKRVFQDTDDNEVDALWLLDLAMKEFG